MGIFAAEPPPPSYCHPCLPAGRPSQRLLRESATHPNCHPEPALIRSIISEGSSELKSQRSTDATTTFKRPGIRKGWLAFSSLFTIAGKIHYLQPNGKAHLKSPLIYHSAPHSPNTLRTTAGIHSQFFCLIQLALYDAKAIMHFAPCSNANRPSMGQQHFSDECVTTQSEFDQQNGNGSVHR